MKTQDLLIDEIQHQPEPVQLEVLHFLRSLIREREQASWEDVLPDREVEQEGRAFSMVKDPKQGEIWLGSMRSLPGNATGSSGLRGTPGGRG